MKGEEYISYRRKTKGSTKQIIQDVLKESRKMAPTCTLPLCQRWASRLCGQVDENERKRNFEEFWLKMSWDTKKMLQRRDLCTQEELFYNQEKTICILVLFENCWRGENSRVPNDVPQYSWAETL